MTNTLPKDGDLYVHPQHKCSWCQGLALIVHAEKNRMIDCNSLMKL
ncbi:MAG: hypothetical protein ACI92E_002336 [Oceanicoccus sp.]|jgi:hypothetical protein